MESSKEAAQRFASQLKALVSEARKPGADYSGIGQKLKALHQEVSSFHADDRYYDAVEMLADVVNSVADIVAYKDPNSFI